MKFVVFAIMLIFLSVSAPAQTAKDLDAKYGAPLHSYEIRPGIFMMPKVATDGRICEMTVEKRHVKSSGSILLDETLMSQDEVTPIVDELAPIDERGKESNASGLSSIVGLGMTSTYDYEDVSITYYRAVDGNSHAKRTIAVSGVAAIVIQWKNRGCN